MGPGRVKTQMSDATVADESRWGSMAGFVQGVDREQVTLFPARLDEYGKRGH